MSKKVEKAVLIFHRKLVLESGLVDERKVWKLPKSPRYPVGIKYRLVLVEPISHVVVLLYDNHHPKGPHIHWGVAERDYKFVTLEKLVKDFIVESELEERRFNESKKNHN